MRTPGILGKQRAVQKGLEIMEALCSAGGGLHRNPSSFGVVSARGTP